MSDCEETDFFWESWMLPGKRKSKKNPQKDKTCKKHKNNITMKTNENIQKKKKKKKKNSKFKEAMEGRKEKKKKKKELSLELDDSFIFTQGYSGASDPTTKLKPEASDPCSTENRLTQDSKKKKRKKKVAFNLSPGYIHAKRPKFVSSSPKHIILPEKEAVRDSDSCSQVAVTGHSQAQALENDSQCTSDDINSQDLFITQKTFRTLPSENSSGEASDKALDATPQTITQQKMVQQSSVVQIKHEESNARLQDSHFHTVLTQAEEDNLHLAEQNLKRQVEKTVSVPVCVKPRVVNPYLDDPIVVNCSMDVEKSKKKSCTSRQQSSSCLLYTDKASLVPQTSTASISTQTENFFTTELSSYLKFCQKSGVTGCFKNLQPLDLSLPQRARKDLERCLSVKMSEIEVKVAEEKLSARSPSSLSEKMKDNGHKDTNLRPSCSSEMKDVELLKEPAVRQLWSVTAQGKGETTPSPQSESEPKSTDTTSSEDHELPSRTGKLDLTQVRAVQMKLNESFFFKTKGEGQSPRPESPLMKLVQSREMKSRKGH